MAWVISLLDSPANAVARAVRAIGVAVRTAPQTPLGFSAAGGAAGSVGCTSATGRPWGSGDAKKMTEEIVKSL